VIKKLYYDARSTNHQDQAFIFLSLWTLVNTSVFSSNLKRKDSLSKHVYAYKTIRNRPGTVDSVRQPVIRLVCASISSGEGYFERWLYIVA